MTEDLSAVRLELEWRRCFPDWDSTTVDEKVEAFDYFCRTYWWIKRPPTGKVRMNLYEAQRETVRLWLKHRKTVTLKARQIGFSTLIATFAFWLAYGWESREILLISQNQEKSRKLLGHAKYGFGRLPEWMVLRGPLRIANTHERQEFIGGSIIASLPSASEPGRGSTAFVAVVDEIGFLPNSTEAYAAVEGVADVGGSLIMLGTANGEGNLLHQLWLGATGVTQQFGQYKPNFWPWNSNGRSQAWYDAQATELPSWQLHSEYPRDPEEAFLKSGRPLFDVDALRDQEILEPRLGELLEGEFIELGSGPLRVWSEPKKDVVYAIGADVAENLEHGDFSSAHVIDVKAGRLVACYHEHIDADLFGEFLVELARFYNKALLGIERNSIGQATILAAKRLKYPHLYRQHDIAQRKEPKTELVGWLTTVKSKGVAIVELARALRGHLDDNGVRIEHLRVPDGPTIQELKTFVSDGKGKMHGSPHDDRVMSLAIAQQMTKYAYLPQYRTMDKPPPGTMGHMMAFIYADDAKKTPVILGHTAVRPKNVA